MFRFRARAVRFGQGRRSIRCPAQVRFRGARRAFDERATKNAYDGTTVNRASRLAVSCVGLTAAAWPALSSAQLAVCARIADPAARLACYDELAGAERERGAGV